MRVAYNKMRFVLFSHSSPGRLIARRLRRQYQTDSSALKEVFRLSKVLRLDSNLLKRIIYTKNSLDSLNLDRLSSGTEQEEILLYLKVENEIWHLILEKESKESLIREDYGRALTGPAIERVAGDKLANVDNDLEFAQNLEDLKRKITRHYYAVAYKYKLPTLRILPFILRLISP